MLLFVHLSCQASNTFDAERSGAAEALLCWHEIKWKLRLALEM
jgi:hypothetical protein